MRLRVFDMVKHRGKLRVVDTPRYREFSASVAEGEMLEMTLGTPQDSYTARQLAYIHGEPVKKLCDALGYTPAQAKLVLLGEFFGWLKGPTGGVVPAKTSLTELTRHEMSTLIDWCPVFGAENGLDIHPPDPELRRSSPTTATTTPTSETDD
jgi:hypothetical protein